MNDKPKAKKRSQEIREFILENVREHPQDITSITADHFGVSRPAVLRHIHKLADEGLLISQGRTRDRFYELAPIIEITQEYKILPGLQEDKIWREDIRPLFKEINNNVLGICQYGVTEIINNVVDHSNGQKMSILTKYSYDQIEFLIRDDGIGRFNKIQSELGLDDPLHVILELSKGKLTTDPEHHTGEGIFYTSRMFDNFAIASGDVFFFHLEKSGDWIVEDRDKPLQGTLVRLRISTKSDRTTTEVFSKYAADEDFGFTRTKVPVFLAQYGDENLVSRSQAKRLLARFDRFREIVLDFSKVEIIGQAFADEIFRVFRNQHPQVDIIPINTNEFVSKMISKVTNQ